MKIRHLNEAASHNYEAIVDIGALERSRMTLELVTAGSDADLLGRLDDYYVEGADDCKSVKELIKFLNEGTWDPGAGGYLVRIKDNGKVIYEDSGWMGEYPTVDLDDPDTWDEIGYDDVENDEYEDDDEQEENGLEDPKLRDRVDSILSTVYNYTDSLYAKGKHYYEDELGDELVNWIHSDAFSASSYGSHELYSPEMVDEIERQYQEFLSKYPELRKYQK